MFVICVMCRSRFWCHWLESIYGIRGYSGHVASTHCSRILIWVSFGQEFSSRGKRLDPLETITPHLRDVPSKGRFGYVINTFLILARFTSAVLFFADLRVYRTYKERGENKDHSPPGEIILLSRFCADCFEDFRE